MKKHFTTGLVILLPIVLTTLIVTFLVDFLTKPFLGLIQKTSDYFFNSSHFFIDHPDIMLFINKFLILTTLAFLIMMMGLLGKLFLIDYCFRLGHYFLHHIPFINRIYKACYEIVHSLFSSSSTSFSQVVLVPFPYNQALSIGLIAKENISIQSDMKQSSDLVSVFVPGTPNPTVGFLLMFKKEQLVFVNMKVDEAMKFVVSCGIVMPDFSIIYPSHLPQIKVYNEK